MRAFPRAVLVALFGIAVVGFGGSASATPVCAGTANTYYACVDPLAGGSYEIDCVYVGPPPCTPVSVPWPAGTACGGPIGEQYCRMYFDPMLCPIFQTIWGDDGDNPMWQCPPYAW